MYPKISVIVPVYRAEKVLSRCIESILNQTYYNFELILVDDGSPDKSKIICDDYAEKDSRIRVVHKNNGGVSSARNAGLKIALGEWICFIDSDDYIDDEYLDNFENMPESDLKMQGYVREKLNKIVETHSFELLNSNDICDIIAEAEVKSIINSPCFKLYKTSIIRKNNIEFDTNTTYGEDHLFSLVYLRYIRNVSISKHIGYHYVLSGTESLTQRVVPADEMLYYIIKSREYSLELLRHFSSRTLLISCNLRLVNNCKRYIRDFFAADNSFEKFKCHKTECKIVFRNVCVGISVSDKFFYFVYLIIPAFISYVFFEKYCNLKY